MAWMRMMGVSSVEYHRLTIIQRSDDYPGQALDYYASRGETPLVWGGSGAAALGLEGNVTEAQYEALYGPGGALDPTTGERLTHTRRPGLELVIAAHKSVAELGVIGFAEDMHRIMDAERDATLAYLDDLTRERGGRRGRAAVACPTEGLVYATARHATSRAGDPAPHDHVLVANVVRMADETGGYKAADTALWREHLHAATMVGRVAAARVAVEMGYGIEADPGPSGRLGHWAIRGIPSEATDVHSKRAAEITAEIERLGYDSYRARQIAARETRDPKRHEPVGDLLPRWHAELDSVGWPVPRLQQELAQTRGSYPRLPLYPDDVTQILQHTLDADGPLAAHKVFTRRDVVVAVAPSLYGHDPRELGRVVDRALADPEVVPLLGVAGARERAYATATVIAREQALAQVVDFQVRRHDAPAVGIEAAREAIAAREQALGASLTPGQHMAVEDIATSGRGVDLVVGVAGAGKTTALAALREAYEAEGYDIVGTSTSGQAARTLARQAGIERSRTLASLGWRLDHGQVALTDRHVVIVDEAAMTDDADLLRLLTAADAARAKTVLVGDFHQLGAVGPGGGFESLVARYEAAVHVLDQNVRQHDPAERQALGQLRDGDLEAAVGWYVANDRLVVAPDHEEALDAVVAGWQADVAVGRHTAMLAWRRANVAELNRRGREVWASLGNLGGAEVHAPGGARYATGDRIVTLAPGADGKAVTSETGVVVVVHPMAKALLVRMDDDGRSVAFGPHEIGPDRLAHGYAITVHRSQGSTLQAAHALEDGGGRELAYVKMSRARERTQVYVVADSVEQASEDLERNWSVERRISWAIDSGTPVLDPAAVEAELGVAAPMRASLLRGRLLAERAALAAAVPLDPTTEIRALTTEREDLRRQRADLEQGRGAYADTPLGEAARALQLAETNCRRLEDNLAQPHLAGRDRRHWRAEARDWDERRSAALVNWGAAARPELERLDKAEGRAVDRLAALSEKGEERRIWLDNQPEAERRLDRIDKDIDALDDELTQARVILDAVHPAPELEHYRAVALEREGPDFGIDIGF